MEIITGIKKGEYMKLRLLTLFLLGLFACICLCSRALPEARMCAKSLTE
ncbi:Uncharacterized protein XB17_00065 [Leptospira santarosai]|nr:Uncharacterized protein XB17_00065 [Leptospira santarosai]